MTSELARHDAVGLAELIRTGQLSPVELVDDTIHRIERLNPQLNAVIHPAFERARKAAGDPELPDGPFRGVPMLIKDLWPGEVGQPFHLGVRALKDADHRATVDANIVTAYREAGFISLGRTNTPEMGLAATTEPLAHGPTRNPWDPTRGAGGSSGGAAAAVAAGMLPAANASDGGGSIRIPAALCGLVGLKPSRFRVSMGLPLKEEWGTSVQHVVCHTVRDSGHPRRHGTPFPGDGVVAPRPPRDPSPRTWIALRSSTHRRARPLDPRRHRHRPRGGPRRAFRRRPPGRPRPRRGRRLASRASTIRPHRATGAQWAAAVAHSLDSFAAWIGRELEPGDVEPATWILAERGRRTTALDVERAAEQAMHFRHAMASWWHESADLLLLPTCLRPAPLLGESSGPDDNPFANVHVTLAYSTLTARSHHGPARDLPSARPVVCGAAIGVQLVAAYGREICCCSWPASSNGPDPGPTCGRPCTREQVRRLQIRARCCPRRARSAATAWMSRSRRMM
ncbi:MAG: amidase family protein [Acidimicrobiales bacterium]